MKKNLNLVDKMSYKEQILRCLAASPTGQTSGGIAKALGVSRNTVTKYLGILEAKQEIYKQEIGSSTLYFVKDVLSFPHHLITSVMQGIMVALKEKMPESPQFYKELGEIVEKQVAFPVIGGDFDELPNIPQEISNRQIFELIVSLIPRIFFVFGGSRLVDFTIEEGEHKAIYTITDTFLLENANYEYGFYMILGFIEARFKNRYHKPVVCDVQEVKFAPLPNPNFVRISIEIL